MRKPVDILREARALITDPKHWTRLTNARDKSGNVVTATNKKAVCWCANGAVRRACRHADGLYTRACNLLQDGAAALLYRKGFSLVNDDNGHAVILRVFDKAIELAEKKP